MVVEHTILNLNKFAIHNQFAKKNPIFIRLYFFVMEKKFKKGTEANYEIELTITAADQKEAKDLMLKHFQKDFEMAGFRK